MSVVAVLLISSLFVLAAMVGLADALVHFVCWGASRLVPRKEAEEPPRPPARGIAA